MYSYIIKNSPYLFIANLLFSLFAFFTTWAMTHLLPKEIFGTYRYILAVISFLAISTLPDMGQAVTRAIAKKKPADLIRIIFQKIKFGLFGALISLGIAVYYIFHGNGELGTLFIICAAFIPFYDVFLIYIHLLYGVKKFGMAAFYESTTRLIAMCILLGIAFLSKNIFVILSVYFLSNTILQLFAFLKVRSKKLIPEAKTTDWTTLRYGKHLTIIGGFATLTANMDKLIIWHLLGAEAIAVYVIALLIANEGSRMIDAVFSIMLPFLAEATDHRNIHRLLRSLPLFFGILLILTGIAVGITPHIFPVIFPAYNEAIPLAQVGFLLLLLTPISSLLYRYLVAEMWRKKMLLLHLSKIICFSITAFLMIPRFGLWGGIIALLSSEILALGFLLHTIIKMTKPFTAS